MKLDPIVQDMIDNAKAGGTILLRPHSTDPQVVKDMIKRSGLERRQHPRVEQTDRREEEEK